MIIALSANAMPSQIELALNSGFDDYLTKPVDIEHVIRVIKSIDSHRSGFKKKAV